MHTAKNSMVGDDAVDLYDDVVDMVDTPVVSPIAPKVRVASGYAWKSFSTIN